MAMLCTSELDRAASVDASGIDTLLTNVAWAICSTYHTVLKASPGAAIFGRDMLFDISFLADWNKIQDYRQHQTDLNTEHENRSHKDWDYKSAIKYCYVKTVSSSNQKAVMNVILGLSHLFIQMVQSGFSAEQNQND
jgi:mRNA-degrading endonuclease HigB of HigAB toxin-antitoxin module